jgi:hypothetical protein
MQQLLPNPTSISGYNSANALYGLTESGGGVLARPPQAPRRALGGVPAHPGTSGRVHRQHTTESNRHRCVSCHVDQHCMQTCCWQDDFPSVDEVRQAALVIFPGSTHSAYEEDEWTQKLLRLLPLYAATGEAHITCISSASQGLVAAHGHHCFQTSTFTVQEAGTDRRGSFCHSAVQGHASLLLALGLKSLHVAWAVKRRSARTGGRYPDWHLFLQQAACSQCTATAF